MLFGEIKEVGEFGIISATQTEKSVGFIYRDTGGYGMVNINKTLKHYINYVINIILFNFFFFSVFKGFFDTHLLVG